MSLLNNIMKLSNLKDVQDVAQKLQAIAAGGQLQGGTHTAGVAPGAGGAPAVNLETELAKLALYVRTIYEVCKQKGIFTDDEFNTKFKELDLLDGVEDGK